MDCPLISCNQTCKNGLFQTKDGCQLCKCRGKYQDPAKNRIRNNLCFPFFFWIHLIKWASEEFGK